VFANASVEFIGHVVGVDRVEPRKMKVAAILNFPRPTDKKVLRQFLSLCSDYRKFVPHFAELASALNDLPKKGRRFEWSEELEKAFTDIKSRLASQPILKTPDFNKPFSLAVDASEKAVWAYLFQQFDGLEHRSNPRGLWESIHTLTG
jgi:hypothetical protein